MSELEELKLAYAECSRQRNELLNKLKSQVQPAQQEPVCIGWDDKTDTPIMGYTSPPAQQEPVAWMVECGGDSALVRHTEKFPGIFAGNEFTKRPLVFGDPSPPAQRTWVGLTLQDREALRDKYDGWTYPGILVDAISDMLKEKNT
jgi:hypothetical protein